jgi:hypothetical protein
VLVATLLGSLCLMSSAAATAHAAPQQPAGNLTQSAITSADTTAGGWKFVQHWTYDEVLANKSMTTTVANMPEKACAGLVLLGAPGRVLAPVCYAYMSWWKGVAHDAQAQHRCFRVVIPAHNPNWSYPSTYTGDWCR